MNAAISPEHSPRWLAWLPWLLWAAAHHSTLAFLGRSFVSAQTLNLVLLAGVLAVVLGWRAGFSLGASALRFHPSAPPLALLGLSAAGDLAARRWLTFDQLPVFFFALGTFALLGCYLPAASWRRLLPAALLLAIALPFGARFGIGLGYFARVLTARGVGEVLSTAGVAAVSAHDVILVENGIAHVDLPCSGLKSLWTGAVFFLAATCVLRRRPGWRWLAAFAACELALLAGNFFRVTVLVLLGLLAEQPRLAALAHLPLGVFGFVLGCGVGVGLLRWVPAVTLPAALEPPSRPLRPVWVVAPLGLLIWILPPIVPAAAVPALPVITPLAGGQQLPLTPIEAGFFASQPATEAHKWGFRHGEIAGSLLVVATTSWQAHHAPELCLTAGGLEVLKLEPFALEPGFELHRLDLEGGRTAVYWFQSPERTTGSLLLRFWHDLARGERRWVLVSTLFDTTVDLRSPALASWLRQLHQDVAVGLRLENRGDPS